MWSSIHLLTAALYFGTFLLAANGDSVSDIESIVTLRIGVAASPPLTIQREDGSLGGYQMDMLMAVKDIAEQEGVELVLDIEDLSDTYASGMAFDLVAGDCNETFKGNKSDCGRFDMMLTPVFSSDKRFVKADLTPPFMQGFVTGVRFSEAPPPEIATFADLQRANGTCCAPASSLMFRTIRETYPGLTMLECNKQATANNSTGCLDFLKAGKCALLGDFVGTLKYQAISDPTLMVLQEALRKGYVIWPMSYELSPRVRALVKKWVYKAVTMGVADDLYTKYYEPKICPLGLAGENCTDYCDSRHGKSDRLGRCTCASTRYIGADCATELTLDEGLIPAYQLAVGYIMFGVNAAAVLFCGAWLFQHRSEARVRMAQPFFLALILFGCLISSSTILAFMQQAGTGRSHQLCMLIPWLYSVGFSVTFGTLFTKIYRVHKVYRSAMRMRRVQVTLLSAVRWIALVLCIDMAILIVWQVYDPMEWTRNVVNSDKNGYVLESVGVCHSDGWVWFAGAIAAFHFVLVSKAAYIGFQTRNVPNNLSGARGVSIAMVSNFQIFLVGLPVLFLVGSDPAVSFFLRSAIVWINDLVVVLAIFGDLIYGNYIEESFGPARATTFSQYPTQNKSKVSSGVGIGESAYSDEGNNFSVARTA